MVILSKIRKVVASVQFQRAKSSAAWNSKIILCGIIAFHLINNFIWLRLDQTSLIYESYSYLEYSRQLFEQLNSFLGFRQSGSGVHFTDMRWHGVFVQAVTAPFYWIFGTSQDAAVFVQAAIFFTVLIVSTYGIASFCFGTAVGLLSAFLISMFPVVFISTRVYLLDIPCASVMAASVWMALRSDGFVKRGFTFLSIILMGISIAIKFNSLLFLPVIFIGLLFTDSFRSNKKFSPWFGLASFLFVAFLFLLLSYRGKLLDIADRAYSISWANFAVGYAPGSPYHQLTSVFSYGFGYFCRFFKDFFQEAMTLPLTIWGLYGVFRLHRFSLFFLFWWIVPSFVLFFLLHNPNSFRYGIPLLVPIVIIAAKGLIDLAHGWRMTFLYAVILFAIVQFFVITYRPSFFDHKFFTTDNTGLHYRNVPKGVTNPYVESDSINDLLSFITHHGPAKPYIKQILYIGVNDVVTAQILERIHGQKLPLGVKAISIPEEKRYYVKEIPRQLFFGADFILVGNLKLEQDLGEERNKFIATVKMLFEAQLGQLQYVRSFTMFDGAEIKLYKRLSEPLELASEEINLFVRNGQVRILYKGREVTMRPGLDYGFTINQRSFTNIDFRWSETKLDDQTIMMRGEIPDLDAFIETKLSFSDSQALHWESRYSGKVLDSGQHYYWKLVLRKEYEGCALNAQRVDFTSHNVNVVQSFIFRHNASDAFRIFSNQRIALPDIEFSGRYPVGSILYVRWHSQARGFAVQVKKAPELSQELLFKGDVVISGPY